MSPNHKLDYALGLLEETERVQFENEIAADARLARELERLTHHLGLLLDDGPGPEPPPGLALRTIERVERRRRWQAVLDYAPARAPFRMADLAVAAGIFLAGILTLLPAVQRSQVAARTAQCASNLRQLGVALIRYATANEAYPFTAPDSPAPYAGTFVSHLHEQGLLHDPRVLDCPSNGPNQLPATLPTFNEIVRLDSQTPRAVPCLLKMDYAYNIGYHRDNQPRPLPARIAGHVPLLADRPAFDQTGQARPGNSPNHGGRGQNVLLADGRVVFLRSTGYSHDPDIYHNRHNQTAPGLDPEDFVLAPGIGRFDGK